MNIQLINHKTHLNYEQTRNNYIGLLIKRCFDVLFNSKIEDCLQVLTYQMIASVEEARFSEQKYIYIFFKDITLGIFAFTPLLKRLTQKEQCYCDDSNIPIMYFQWSSKRKSLQIGMIIKTFRVCVKLSICHRFIQYQQIIIQMGNSLQQQSQDWHHSLQPLPSDPLYDYLSLWKTNKGQTLLAREIDLPQQVGRQIIKSRLQKRQKIMANVYPLSQCYFQQFNTLCSQQERCLLTCQKPKKNLQKIYEQRRLSGIPFTSAEIGFVITNISLALRNLSLIGQPFFTIRMNHIAINDSVFLIDPILIESDPFGYGSMGQYPSPEQLREENNFISGQAALSIHLFSLGIIGLQLYNLSHNIKEIYIRYHKYGKIEGIDYQKLNSLLNRVADQQLRTKLGILTTQNHQNRRNIFKVIQQESTTENDAKNIVKSLEECYSNINSISPQVKQVYTPVNRTIIKQAKHQQNVPLSPINMNTTFTHKAPSSDLNNLVKPKVSINFVSKIHQSTLSFNPQQPCKAVKRYPPIQNSQPQKQNLLSVKRASKPSPQTPMKSKAKHIFSTIKQVSQHDDESACTSRLKTFEDFANKGSYEGELKDGKKSGNGVMIFQEGSIYDGEWIEDQMHGFGRLFYPNGKIAYEGEWKNNQFYGRGKVYNYEPVAMNSPFNFTDFNQLAQEWISYQGDLLQDQKHGRGCLILSNGQQYRGEFFADKIHGQGNYITMNRTIIKGIWRDSILQRTFNQ